MRVLLYLFILVKQKAIQSSHRLINDCLLFTQKGTAAKMNWGHERFAVVPTTNLAAHRIEQIDICLYSQQHGRKCLQSKLGRLNE